MTGPVATFHDPVMVNEVLGYLQPRSGTIVDATVGGGGHARAILSVLAGGEFGTAPAEQSVAGSPADRGTAGGRRWPCGLLGFDRDPEAIASAAARLGDFENVELVHASYLELPALVRRGRFAPVTGVLFDLGVSLHQLVSPERGFSFDSSGPIDMRFDLTSDEPTALALIRRASERELRSWLREFGEEPMSGRVARCIWERRGELRTTGELAQVVRRAVPARFGRKALARVFQALRVITNHELEAVAAGLDAALSVLSPGGRMVVLAYHSLEDRIVKQFFRTGRIAGGLRVLTGRPVRPAEEEVRANPRARSARLRAAEKAIGPAGAVMEV